MSVIPLTPAHRSPCHQSRLIGGLTLVLLLTVAATVILAWQMAFAQTESKAKPTTDMPDPVGQKAAEVSTRAADLQKRLAADTTLPETARKEYGKDAGWLAEQSQQVSKLAAAHADLSARLGAIEANLRAADQREKERFEALDKKLSAPPTAVASPRPPTDVLILALHSADLSVARVRGPIQAQFEPRARADRDPGTRVGLMVAIGGEVQKELLIKLADAKTTPTRLDALGQNPSGVAEQLADLGADVLNQYDSSAKTVRRVVVVASDRAAPPTDSRHWVGLQVDCVLVADGHRPDADKLLAWHQFTAARGGGVAVVQFDKLVKDDTVLAQMETHLGRFLLFAPVGGK